MQAILDFFGNLINSFLGFLELMVRAITSFGSLFFNGWLMMADLQSLAPSFLYGFAGAVIALCGLGLILKLIPFIG